MNIKPILFNTDMVRAIQNGTKTVTRRVVRPQPTFFYAHGGKIADPDNPENIAFLAMTEKNREDAEEIYVPPYQPGDILYVRETWLTMPTFYTDGRPAVEYLYKADMAHPEDYLWHPSIHMPREAARIFLRVKHVRVERLQEVTELDILEKEGITVDFPQPKPSYMSLAYTETRLKPAVRKAFADLWDSTIKKANRALYGWDANPWVWVIEFERISKEEAENAK